MTGVLRNRRIVVLLACCAAVVGLAAGCGSGSSSGVPNGDAALVDGQPIKEAQLTTILAQYVESLKVAKQAVPKKGSAAYVSIQQRLAQYLVTRTEFEQQAKKLGVAVTPKEIDAGVKRFVVQYFGGSQKKFLAAMKKQHATLQQVRQNVAFTTLQNNLVKKLTGALKVSDSEAIAYYNKNITQYRKAESRDVEHIVVKTKQLADKIYKQLKNGADFAKLARKYSIDPGSKVQGGKLGPVSKGGSYDPTFVQTVFSKSLKTGQISKPVHLAKTSQPVWDVIKPLSDITPQQVTPFSKEKAGIVQQLLQAKKSDTMSSWQNTVQKYYSTRVKYASAYAPPAQTTAPAPTSLLPTTTVSTG
jgi:parvulin-like peptidyl-prolyl isomerase